MPEDNKNGGASLDNIQRVRMKMSYADSLNSFTLPIFSHFPFCANMSFEPKLKTATTASGETVQAEVEVSSKAPCQLPSLLHMTLTPKSHTCMR